MTSGLDQNRLTNPSSISFETNGLQVAAGELQTPLVCRQGSSDMAAHVLLSVDGRDGIEIDQDRESHLRVANVSAVCYAPASITSPVLTHLTS